MPEFSFARAVNFLHAGAHITTSEAQAVSEIDRRRGIVPNWTGFIFLDAGVLKCVVTKANGKSALAPWTPDKEDLRCGWFLLDPTGPEADARMDLIEKLKATPNVDALGSLQPLRFSQVPTTKEATLWSDEHREFSVRTCRWVVVESVGGCRWKRLRRF